MPDLNFDCPQCGQNLDAPDDMAGLFVECPSCSKIIKVPRPGDPKPAPSARPAPAPQPKAAPPPTPVGPDEKGSTIAIKLPPNMGVPPTPQRKIIIKRKGG